MKIPKYQTGTPNGGVQDNTRVVNPHLQVLPLAQFPRLQPTPYYGDPRQPQLKADTRTPREQQINDQEGKKKAETQRWLEQRERNAEAFNNLMRLTMPSTYVGQIMGQELTGLPALAVDLAAGPIAGTAKAVGRKGVQLVSRGFQRALPKVSLGRDMSGKWNGWINVGNYQYRPSRNTLSMNFPVFERKPVTEIFEQNRWNRFRNPKYVTEADKIELESHFPEYKTIQERAMDERNYMIIPENYPLSKMSTQLDDGRLLFTGDEGTWIQSQSQNFKAYQNGKTMEIGFKGGTDQKGIKDIETHAPETFPLQENGVFFAGPRDYADTYNHGKISPGFWLGFRKPYNMLNGEKKAFPLEDNNVRFARGVMSSPSYKGGELPIQTYNTINKVWNAEYLNDPEIIQFLSRDPNKMSLSELVRRENLLRTIRQGQLSENEVLFNKMVEARVKSGQMNPLRSQYYDGFIGRDHALGWSPRRDFKWNFGSNPETYVIFRPEQAKLLVGNNGAFSDLSAYSRKKGGKLNHL